MQRSRHEIDAAHQGSVRASVQTDLLSSCFVGTATLLSPGRSLPASKCGHWQRGALRRVLSLCFQID